MFRQTDIVADSPAGIERAAALLRGGELVAFPTETVYGLGGDATDDRAVAAIFETKGRPQFNPLIVHCADAEMARRLVAFDERADLLTETCWPGPLTLVLPRRPDSGLSLLVSAGLDSVAVRMPAHPTAHRLLAATGRPVAAPSANRSGAVSPTTAQHVQESLGGRIPLILAAGRCEIGLESTVLDLTREAPALLRPGGATREEIEVLIGPVLLPDADPERPLSPGQLSSHYAPRAGVRLNVRTVEAGEALLTFGPDLRKGSMILNLSETGDLAEAAANLFAHLRTLDRTGATSIAVVPIPEEGLGVAINDRLRRAAAPRTGA